MVARGMNHHGVARKAVVLRALFRQLVAPWSVALTALCLAVAGVVQAAPAASTPASVVWAPAAPALDAIVTYETRQVTSSGVLQTEVWKERIVRRGDTVWTERVVPPQAHAVRSHESQAEHAGHKHFDVDGAARWVQLDSKGQAVLRCVDRSRRMVVSVPKAEFDAVGFDGRFDAAAHIVPPSVVERMPVPASASRDGVWHVENGGDWSHRVLWSVRKQVALRVESERLDGSFKRTVIVEPVAAGAVLPWTALSGYAQKEYDDFMD